MATGVAYLEGGPCAGTTHKLTPAEADEGQLVCKGGLYTNPEQGQLHNGDVVFEYAGDAPGTPASVNAPRAHKGWHELRRSMNTNWPHALRDSEKLTRAALRSLHRARKVRL